MLGDPRERFNYTNIDDTSTNSIKTGQGFLHSVVINTQLADGVVEIYDNTAASGTVIATITSPSTLLADGPKTAIYDVKFTTGLTVKTSGANQDVTVTWV